jgi:hypothetical protein
MSGRLVQASDPLRFATAALIKGAALALMGPWVFGSTVWHAFILVFRAPRRWG